VHHLRALPGVLPLDIDLPAMISEAKAEALATRWQDQFYCNIGLLFGAVIFDRDRRQVVKCDLCSGVEP